MSGRMYEVEYILDNDLDALMSRILYLQARKPSIACMHRFNVAPNYM